MRAENCGSSSRVPVAADLAGQFLGLGQQRPFVSATRAMPTRSLPSRNSGLRPAGVLLADHQLGGTHILEEHLVDLDAAVDQLDQAHLDAGVFR